MTFAVSRNPTWLSKLSRRRNQGTENQESKGIESPGQENTPDITEASRVMFQISLALQQGDMGAVQRLAQDLEDIGIQGLMIECRPVAKNGDRVRASLNLSKGAVEIISVNGEQDPVKIEKYSRLLTFEVISGMGRGSFQRQEFFKDPREMTPDEIIFYTAQDMTETTILTVET